MCSQPPKDREDSWLFDRARKVISLLPEDARAEPGLHDFIVQAVGAFDETMHGILNLASLSQAVEIRIVVQRHTVPVLQGLEVFIVRNLPFVAQVALMGLDICRSCSVRDACGGVFTTSGNRLSKHLHPVP